MLLLIYNGYWILSIKIVNWNRTTQVVEQTKGNNSFEFSSMKNISHIFQSLHVINHMNQFKLSLELTELQFIDLYAYLGYSNK